MQINFQKNFDAILKHLKIDRATAAERVNITRHSLRMLLGYGAPTARTVNRLAEGLGVAPSEFILGPSKKLKRYERPLNVAKRVLAIMALKDISAEDLAIKMRWDGRGSAHHFFKTNNPRIMRLPSIAQALGVELKELVK